MTRNRSFSFDKEGSFLLIMLTQHAAGPGLNYPPGGLQTKGIIMLSKRVKISFAESHYWLLSPKMHTWKLFHIDSPRLAQNPRPFPGFTEQI